MRSLAISGALGSSKRARLSGPRSISQPHAWQSAPSPVASTKARAVIRPAAVTRCPVLNVSAIMRPSGEFHVAEGRARHHGTVAGLRQHLADDTSVYKRLEDDAVAVFAVEGFVLRQRTRAVTTQRVGVVALRIDHVLPAGKALPARPAEVPSVAVNGGRVRDFSQAAVDVERDARSAHARLPHRDARAHGVPSDDVPPFE